MRHIGRPNPTISAEPSAEALRLAAIHQATGIALAAIHGADVIGVGIPKGIYRFKTHEQANQHADEAQARVIAWHLEHQKR